MQGPDPHRFRQLGAGTLGDDDCLPSNGAWQESWSLELSAEAAARIDMISEDVDPYLILKDDLGDEITSDDVRGEDPGVPLSAMASARAQLLVEPA